MDFKDNLEIDLIDLGKYVLRRWKVLIIGMVIGAVVLGSYGYYKSAKTVSVTTGEAVTNSATGVEKLRNVLSDSSAASVEEAARKNFELMDRYESYTNYYRKSIFMSLDAQNVSNMVSMYSVDYNHKIDDEDIYYTGGAASILRCELTSDPVINSVKEALGIDIGNSYIRELISVDADGENVLYIKVYGESEEMCRSIMDILNAHIDSVKAKVEEGSDCKINYIDSYSKTDADEMLRSEQLSVYQELGSFLQAAQLLATNMSVDQKNYYQELLDEGRELRADGDGEKKEDSTEDVKITRSISKKYIVLGLVGGLFLVSALFAASYILSARLHIAEDLKSGFGLSVLGEISADKPDVTLVSQSAAIIAGKLSCEKIYVMGASGDDISKSIREDVCNELVNKNQLKDTKFGSSAVNDALSMQYLSDADSVILVERIDQSAYSDIDKEIELCKSFDVKILGAVVIK